MSGVEKGDTVNFFSLRMPPAHPKLRDILNVPKETFRHNLTFCNAAYQSRHPWQSTMNQNFDLVTISVLFEEGH